MEEYEPAPDKQDHQEAEWVRRAHQKDQVAFDWLVAKHRRVLDVVIRRQGIDGSLATDVAQDVWVIVFRKLPTLPEPPQPKRFRRWLLKIARDKAIDAIRHQKSWRGKLERFWKQLRHNLRGSPDQGEHTCPCAAAMRSEEQEAISRVLNTLTEAHRQALTLYYLANMSQKDIAEVMECPVGTVKTRLSYAKVEFRRAAERLGLDLVAPEPESVVPPHSPEARPSAQRKPPKTPWASAATQKPPRPSPRPSEQGQGKEGQSHG